MSGEAQPPSRRLVAVVCILLFIVADQSHCFRHVVGVHAANGLLSGPWIVGDSGPTRAGSQAWGVSNRRQLIKSGRDGSIKAMFIFGDSGSDVGNNKYGPASFAQADFYPYGIDYVPKSGRFSNGQIAVDFIGVMALTVCAIVCLAGRFGARNSRRLKIKVLCSVLCSCYVP